MPIPIANLTAFLERTIKPGWTGRIALDVHEGSVLNIEVRQSIRAVSDTAYVPAGLVVKETKLCR